MSFASILTFTSSYGSEHGVRANCNGLYGKPAKLSECRDINLNTHGGVEDDSRTKS